MKGERLVKLRRERGLTQAKLAQMLSVSKFSISLYENNRSVPTEEALTKIAKAFDVSIDYLVGLIDEPYSYNRKDDDVFRLSRQVPREAHNIIRVLVDTVNNEYNREKESASS